MKTLKRFCVTTAAVLGGLLFLAAGVVAPTQDRPGSRRNSGPIAKLKESIVCCPMDTVTLDGWASISPGGEITKWGWDLDGDGTVDTSTTTGELQIVAPEQPCSRTLRLIVKDRTGSISPPDSMILHVMNSPPRVSLRPDTTVKVGVRLAFEPRIWCNCSKPVYFEWDFNGDGTAEYKSEETGNTSRVYTRPGRYTAKFRVIDGMGREAGGVQVVRVLAEQAGSRSH